MAGTLNMNENRIMNVQKPTENKDVVRKEYFVERIGEIFQQQLLKLFSTSFHKKDEDIDMNNKAFKNLSWPDDINDAVPKKYLYQNGLLMDNKTNSFNAKDKRIANVADPENLQDVATKNYVDSLDSAIQDSLMKQITDVNKSIPDPINDNDAVNKKCLLECINANIWEPITPPNNVA
jgi:hypothetical protein